MPYSRRPPSPAELDSIPRRYVGGWNIRSNDLLIIGEAPGQTENSVGLPFVGHAGEELNRYLAWGASIDRRDVSITNLSKFWPLHDWKGKQLPPTPQQIADGSQELLVEIAIVRPKIIIAAGAYAARFLLGDSFVSLYRDHGIPRSIAVGLPSGGSHHCSLIPAYHPAAGLHSDRQQIEIEWDFQQLGRLIRGEIDPRPPVDEFLGRERYFRITDRDCSGPPQYLEDRGADLVASILAGQTEIAIDTEGTISDPWCLTLSVRPGEAWLIRSTEPESLAALDRHINAPSGICTVITHYEAHDLPVAEAMGVRIAHKHTGLNPDGSLTNRDTMSEAFLLGGYHPKGLKPLSWRLCGMEMDSYEDLVGPTELAIVTGYLQSAFERLKCSICNGDGRVAKFGVRMIGRSDCGVCGGSGRVGISKSGKPLKNPRPCDCRIEETYQLKTDEKCGYCVDGLLAPLPDREFVFDADKADWRWKQPQSLARWIRRRLKNADVHGDAESDQAAAAEEGGTGFGSEGDQEDDEEPSVRYFKPRRDWNDLRGRSDRAYVEVICGPLPRTTLSDVPDQDRVTIYANRDADATLRNARKLDPMIRSLGLAQTRGMDASFLPYLSRMEQSGMPINRPHFELLRDHLDSRMQEVRDRLSLTVGERMNPNGEGIADLLFNQLGLPTMKLTTSGSRESIDDDVLGALKAQLRKRGESDGQARLSLSVLDCVTDYREVQKQKSGYVDPILDFSDRFDVIRTTYNYTSAATGRLSSSDPINAQTFPNPDNYPADLNRSLNYGVQIRSGIVAGKGYKLIGVDFSQIEMVIGAHITQDAGMLKVFRDGLNLHYYAASMMFDIPYDKVPRQLRTQIKPLNFGSFYGLTAIGLRAQFASLPNGSIEKTEAECQELIDRYYAAFPGVLEWKERLWQQAEIDGCVRDLFGRLRLTPGLRSNIKRVRSAAEREAANMPIQSTANGIIRIASRLLWERTLPLLWAEQIDIQPMMQTHDENVMRCQEDAAEYSAVMIAGTMQGAVRLSVPIRCEPKIGDNLYEIK